MPRQTIDIPFKSIVRVFVVALTILFLFAVRDFIALLLLAIVLASGITPFVNWLEDQRVPRIVSLLVVVVSVFMAMTLFLRALVPALIGELQNFTENFPLYAELVADGIRSLGIVPESTIGQGIAQALRESASILGKGVNSLSALTVRVFGGVISLATVLLSTFYLALERDGVEKFLRLLTPEKKEPYIVDLWRRAQRKIGSWVRGQLLLMFIIGVITFIGLSLLDVRFALLLAITAALFEIVPIVGPIVSGTLAVLVTLFQSTTLALFVVFFYIALQQIEGQLIVPMLYRRILRLHPVMTIFALLIGARFGGIVGLFLAVPITAVIAELSRDFAKRKAPL